LHYASRVDAVNAAPIVDVQCQRYGACGCEGDAAFALPPAGRFDAALLGYDFILECVPELVITKPTTHQQTIMQ
jgi:hypothetical protein